MFKKKKLDLHPEPKRTIQINRPLIMAISATIFTVLLLAIVGAFTTTKKTQDIGNTKTKIKTDKPMAINPEIQKLPGDYSDISGIRKFLPKSENGRLSALMQRINQLQSEQERLRLQLASKKEPAAPRKPFIDPKTKQARSSGLVFSGIESNVDSMVGGKSGTSRTSRTARLGNKKDENLIPTKEQAELIKEQNKNTREIAALKGKDKPEDIYDMHNVVTPMSPYQVMAGTLIPATLITGIDTTFAGTIIAQVRSNIYDTVTGKHLLIPKGSKLLGQYGSRTITGQRRIRIAFNRIIRPDGSSILLSQPIGVGMGGKSGIEGDVNNHWARIIGASTISTILSVGAGIAADRSDDDGYRSNSSSRAILGGTKGITNVGEKITSRALSIKPTITLSPGHQFNVAVKKDMVLNPYKPRR